MKPARRRLANVTVAVAFIVLTTSAPASRADSLQGEWCGDDVSNDWVCPTRGTVYASRHLLRSAVAVPINNRILITAQESSAHLAFGELANCTLEEASKIVPWGAHADNLFTQYRGAASCVSSGLSRVRVACGHVDQCPTELRANGTFLFKSFPPSEATASSTRVKRQRVVMESCGGFIEVRVHTPGGVQRGSGSGSPGVYVFIEVLVTSRTVETPWGGSVEEFAKVKSVTESASPGECTNSSVQEEEELVGS